MTQQSPNITFTMTRQPNGWAIEALTPVFHSLQGALERLYMDERFDPAWVMLAQDDFTALSTAFGRQISVVNPRITGLLNQTTGRMMKVLSSPALTRGFIHVGTDACDYCETTENVQTISDRIGKEPDIHICRDCWECGEEPRLDVMLTENERQHLAEREAAP